MSQDAELRCRCGTVTGVVRDATPDAVTRMLCYCADCQAFAHYLGRADLLDAKGGTEVVQVAPAAMSFQRGQEHIACVRLASKGLYRWYARCCHTPLGNTVQPSVPFIGVAVQAFPVTADGRGPDQWFGRVIGAVRGESAIGTPPRGSTGFNLRLIARAVGKMLGWRLTGRVWPHPFFERETGAPRYPVRVLTAEERDALRPLCGPRPAVSAAAPGLR